MFKNKKVIIFDLDGTLIDSIGVWNDIDRELIEELGTIEFDNINIGKQRDTKLKEFSKSEDMYLDYCGFLKEKYGFKESKEEVKKRRYEIAQNYLKIKIDYKENAEKVIGYLKEKGFILAIATTTNHHTVDVYRTENMNLINKANLDDYFSLIFAKDVVKELKPNPEVHIKIMEELNVEPEECLIIEDSLIGVEAANNAGIEVVALYDKYSDADRDEINKLSEYHFDEYPELSTYILKTYSIEFLISLIMHLVSEKINEFIKEQYSKAVNLEDMSKKFLLEMNNQKKG